MLDLKTYWGECWDCLETNIRKEILMSPVREDKCSAVSSAIELLQEQGFDGMRKAIEILMNEAMKLERNEALGA